MEHHTDDKPPNKGSEKSLARRVLGCVSGFSVTFQNNSSGWVVIDEPLLSRIFRNDRLSATSFATSSPRLADRIGRTSQS